MSRYEKTVDEAVQQVSLHVHEPTLPPQEPSIEGAHPVDFYVQIALEENPEIQAALNGVWAAAEKIPQVTALDDPVLAETFQPIDDHSLQTAAGRAPNVLTLSQRFPWLGKLRLRGEIAEEEVQIALTRLVQAQLKVVEDVKVAYAEVFFAQRAIQITKHNIELLEDLLSFAEARYRTGQSSQQDVLRAQVELDRLEDRLIALRRRLRQAQADLAAVLHTSPEADLRAVEELETPSVPEQIQALYEAAVQCRPELQERLHAIVLSQHARELAELQYYPDVTLGFGWQAVTADEALARSANGNDNVAFLIGVNLPIWYDRLDAAVRQAEYQTMENARRYDATKDDTFRLIKRLVVQANALDEQAKLFRDSIVPKAEQTLRVSTADYRVGRVDFEQILDNWTDLLNFQIQLVRLEASLAQTLATLERVIGCELAEVPEVVGSQNSAVEPPQPLPPNAADKKKTAKQPTDARPKPESKAATPQKNGSRGTPKKPPAK